MAKGMKRPDRLDTRTASAVLVMSHHLPELKIVGDPIPILLVDNWFLDMNRLQDVLVDMDENRPGIERFVLMRSYEETWSAFSGREVLTKPGFEETHERMLYVPKTSRTELLSKAQVAVSKFGESNWVIFKDRFHIPSRAHDILDDSALLGILVTYAKILLTL